MLKHNAGLTNSHPYASTPIEWPFQLKGISFWTNNDAQQQIYMIGNVFGAWGSVAALSIFAGIWGADQLSRRRGQEPIEDRKWGRLTRLLRSLYLQMLDIECTTQSASL